MNADMKVGDVSETVNVSGESPVVDVQNARVQNVLSKELSTRRQQAERTTLRPGGHDRRHALGGRAGCGRQSGLQRRCALVSRHQRQ